MPLQVAERDGAAKVRQLVGTRRQNLIVQSKSLRISHERHLHIGKHARDGGTLGQRFVSRRQFLVRCHQSRVQNRALPQEKMHLAEPRLGGQQRM